MMMLTMMITVMLQLAHTHMQTDHQFLSHLQDDFDAGERQARSAPASKTTRSRRRTPQDCMHANTLVR